MLFVGIGTFTLPSGKSIEELGWYDPLAKDDSKKFNINTERAQYWLSTGAQPSKIVGDLLKQTGFDVRGK